MRVNRWELNRGYRGKSSGRNDLRLIECVLRVFGNRGRRSDPESSILTIFARPHDFSKLPKTQCSERPSISMAFGTTAGSAAAGRPPRLGPPRVLAFFFQWNDNPRPFVWTATVDSIQGEALAMSNSCANPVGSTIFARRVTNWGLRHLVCPESEIRSQIRCYPGGLSDCSGGL